MLASAKRQCAVSQIARRRPHGKAALSEDVLDLQLQRERVPRPGVQDIFEACRAGRLVDDAPVEPPSEAVAGIASGHLIDRQLVLLAAEFVLTVSQSVRPWQQRLPAPAVGHCFDAISVEDGLSSDGVLAEAATDFDHNHPLGSARELALVPGRGFHAYARTWYASGLTKEGRGLPAMPARTFSAAILAISPRVLNEAEAMCGTIRQFGSVSSL